MSQRLSASATEFSPLAYSRLPPQTPHPTSGPSLESPAGNSGSKPQQQQPSGSGGEQPGGGYKPPHQRDPDGEGSAWSYIEPRSPAQHSDPADGGIAPRHAVWDPADAQHMEDWHQQVEEAVALQAILEDTFLLLAGLPESALDSDAPDPTELAAPGPLDGSYLECQIAVYVDVPSRGIHLQAVDAAPPQDTVLEPSVPDEPQASPKGGGDETPAATSREEWRGPTVHHLPPLCVKLLFPRDYPSSSPPEVQLSALWLTPADSAALRRGLAALWDEQGCGFPTCYAWVEWLQCTALPTLGHITALPMVPVAASQKLLLPDPNTVESPPRVVLSTGAGLWRPAPRNVPGEPMLYGGAGRGNDQIGGTSQSETRSRPQISAGKGRMHARAVEEVTVQLLMFDAARDFQLFQKGTWECSVCFEEALGRNCVRISGCSHVFCAECVGLHCSIHVKEGSVSRLTCLAHQCTSELSQQVLARVLSAEEMERCEALTLARTLDCMADLVYCPRCEGATIEDSQHCAQCSQCLFAFCSLCNESWHPGGGCVSIETQLAIIRQRMAGRRDNVEALRRQEGEMLSLARIKKTTKQCPTCSMAIDKSEGCNKMTCTYCGSYFCFRCLKVISGYDHFQGSACILFDDAEVQRWNLQFENERRMLGQVPEGVDEQVGPIRWNNRRCPCPQCGTANNKENNNNHMNCWACATPFCFLCRSQLRKEGGRHFGRAPKCKQHTIE